MSIQHYSATHSLGRTNISIISQVHPLLNIWGPASKVFIMW